MLWNHIKNRTPLATESGCWDGLRSEELLVATSSNKYHIVRMYEGFLDGYSFRNFYDQDDFEIENVKYWIEIDSPL